MNRQDILRDIRTELEASLWNLMTQLEGTLSGLARVEHFDPEDATAVGAVIHAALPDAIQAAGLGERGFSCRRYKSGPSNKITVRIGSGESARAISIELHYCGPQGGTSKASHQFAESDVDREPELPGFAAAAPEDTLLFLAYHLTPTRTSVAKLFLMFADGVDRKKIELHRLDEVAETTEAVVREPDVGPVGTKVTVKRKAIGDDGSDARKADKRGDAASSS